MTICLSIVPRLNTAIFAVVLNLKPTLETQLSADAIIMRS